MFKEHIAEVQATLRAERLLTFDLQAGREPLCAFLGMEVPEGPIPPTNSSRQFREQEWADPPAEGGRSLPRLACHASFGSDDGRLIAC